MRGRGERRGRPQPGKEGCVLVTPLAHPLGGGPDQGPAERDRPHRGGRQTAPDSGMTSERTGGKGGAARALGLPDWHLRKACCTPLRAGFCWGGTREGAGGPRGSSPMRGRITIGTACATRTKKTKTYGVKAAGCRSAPDAFSGSSPGGKGWLRDGTELSVSISHMAAISSKRYFGWDHGNYVRRLAWFSWNELRVRSTIHTGHAHASLC